MKETVNFRTILKLLSQNSITALLLCGGIEALDYSTAIGIGLLVLAPGMIGYIVLWLFNDDFRRQLTSLDSGAEHPMTDIIVVAASAYFAVMPDFQEYCLYIILLVIPFLCDFTLYGVRLFNEYKRFTRNENAA